MDLVNKNSAIRDLWIEKQLKTIPRGQKILDAGAGELKWKEACENLTYTSQDFCQYTGNGDGAGLQMGKWDTKGIDIVSDICNIPVDENSFDVILCSEVLEHIPYPARAVKEFGRILKVGGKLILTAPFCSLTHFAPYHFSTGFSKYWYETVLGENDFEIEEITSYGDFYAYLQQELMRLPSVMQKYSGHKIGWLCKCAMRILAKKLEKLYENNGSNELLCFGFLVKATYMGVR